MVPGLRPRLKRAGDRGSRGPRERRSGAPGEELRHAAGPIFSAHGGRPVGQYAVAENEIGEGQTTHVVMMEFPTRDAIRSVFKDPGYTELIPSRTRAFPVLDILISRLAEVFFALRRKQTRRFSNCSLLAVRFVPRLSDARQVPWPRRVTSSSRESA